MGCGPSAERAAQTKLAPLMVRKTWHQDCECDAVRHFDTDENASGLWGVLADRGRLQRPDATAGLGRFVSRNSDQVSS